jgi:hypothetical protein
MHLIQGPMAGVEGTNFKLVMRPVALGDTLSIHPWTRP